jgi:hypothetical protein
MAITFRITCPCGCREMVGASDLGFSATSVTVDACSYAKGLDTAVASFEVTKSRVLEILTLDSLKCPVCNDNALWCPAAA